MLTFDLADIYLSNCLAHGAHIRASFIHAVMGHFDTAGQDGFWTAK